METETIWNEFSLGLKKFILGKVKDETIAEDILQEVFIKIHLQKDKLQKKDRLKSWIFTIANNAVLDYFRKQSKNNNKPDFIIPDTTGEEKEHQAKNCLLPLISNLPEKYKNALLLSEIKDLKQIEVAKQLNISLPAAKSRILRGRELLKKGFMDCCDYTLDENGHLKGEHKDKLDCKVCS